MRAAVLGLLLTSLADAVVLDRIAVVVENRVIKDSDIDREIRITSYLNGEKSDFTVAGRKKAADRLIDQAIIRREMDLGRYPEATPEETEKLLADTKKSHVQPSSYGINEDQLRRALRWQLTVLRFIDLRFRPRPENTTDKDPFLTWLDEARSRTSIAYKESDLK